MEDPVDQTDAQEPTKAAEEPSETGSDAQAPEAVATEQPAEEQPAEAPAEEAAAE